jgi:hypothetical protein
MEDPIISPSPKSPRIIYNTQHVIRRMNIGSLTTLKINLISVWGLPEGSSLYPSFLSISPASAEDKDLKSDRSNPIFIIPKLRYSSFRKSDLS